MTLKVHVAQLNVNASEVTAILKCAGVQMRNASEDLRDANVLEETAIIKTVLAFVKK